MKEGKDRMDEGKDRMDEEKDRWIKGKTDRWRDTQANVLVRLGVS